MPLVPHTPAAEAHDHAALIVALDAGDLAGDEQTRALALTDTCAGCAVLRDDLAAIRGAMTALPVPPRRRDFRLTEDDAARLRPSGWRRLVGWLAAPRSSVRPLATGLATLGVVGLLLTAGIPGFAAGGATILSTVGSPVGDSVTGEQPYGAEQQAGTAAPLAAPGATPAATRDLRAPAASAGAAERPSALPGEQPVAGAAGESSNDGSGDVGRAAAAPEDGTDELKAQSSDAGIPLPVVASIALLAAGLGLFAARTLAIRRLA